MLRITNSMMVNDLKRNMNNNMLRMDDLQRQLSTNRKINKPSDDPAGIVKALRFRTNLTEGEQYLANISEASNFMQTTDDSLNSMTEILHKIRELTVKAATGTNDKDANRAIADEISQFNEQLKMVANSAYGSKYIFGGTNVTETPYQQNGQWIGNDQQLELEVGVGVKMPINLDMQDYFMGKLDSLYLEPGSQIRSLEAAKLQEGLYKVNTKVEAAATTLSSAGEAQSYLSSVDSNKRFFYENSQTAGTIAVGTVVGNQDSQVNGSIMMEVKSVKTGVGKGEPRATLGPAVAPATNALTFDRPMYLKDGGGAVNLIPDGDLTAHFTYTKNGVSSGVITSAANQVVPAPPAVPTSSTVAFTIGGVPTIGDTIEWNNTDIASTVSPYFPGGSKLCGADGKEYTPVKMVYTATGWVYDDKAKVTVDLKAHLYNNVDGSYKYVELENVELNMEAGVPPAAAADQTICTISGAQIGAGFSDLVLWNNGTAALGSIDPRNQQIKVGDKTIISLTAAQTAADSQRVDMNYTYKDQFGKDIVAPVGDNNSYKHQYAFKDGYFDNKTQTLKFFTLNQQTGLSYDGSISLITDNFTTSNPANPPSSFDYKAGLFSYVEDLARKVTVGKLPQVGNELAGSDLRMQDILLYRATIGARINRLELQSSRLESTQESYTALLAFYEDANAAEVIMNLKMQESVYQSSLSAGARIIQPTLVDFLR